MPHTKETTVYMFDELSDRAKDRARDWYRSGQMEDWDASDTLSECAEVCATLGISLNTKTVKLMGGGTRQEPVIYYSGFSSQGDGATFEGIYSYSTKAKTLITEWPTETKLHAIVRDLQTVQRRHFYKLEASIVHHGHYYHEMSNTIEVTHADTGNEVAEHVAEPLREALRDIMRWIYRQLEAEWDYQMSEQVIDDGIRANEYEFDEDGNRE